MQRCSLALRAIVIVAAFFAGGCYRHVVGAKGYGAAGTDLHEPNVKEPGREQKTPIQRTPPERMRSDGK